MICSYLSYGSDVILILKLHRRTRLCLVLLRIRMTSYPCSKNEQIMPSYFLRAFIGVETAALTFRTKQYSTSYSSHICYNKRFYNDFFLNHNTIALVRNCLKLLSCVVIETALDRMKINYLNSLLSTRKRTI